MYCHALDIQATSYFFFFVVFFLVVAFFVLFFLAIRGITSFLDATL